MIVFLVRIPCIPARETTHAFTPACPPSSSQQSTPMRPVYPNSSLGSLQPNAEVFSFSIGRFLFAEPDHEIQTAIHTVG